MPARELLLSSPPGFRLPDLGGLNDGVRAAPVQELQFQTISYDTPDLRLARGGARMRYRSDEGWTVTVPSSGGNGAVVEHHLEGDPGSPPDSALDLLTALTRARPLEPVARLRTARRRIPLVSDDGALLGELLEDEVSVLEGVHLAARFRELEIRTTELAPAELPETIAAHLRELGAGPPDPTPRVVRALGWRALDPPDVEPVEVRASSTAGEVVRAAIAASVLRLLLHDPGVRVANDPEDVHQARVATRRLRSDLRTFRNLLDPDWNASLRDELRWLGQELGAVRDTEVLLDRVRDRIDRLPPEDQSDAKPVVQTLLERWDEARASLLAAMRSPRYHRLLDRLVAAAREPVLAPGAGELTGDVLTRLVGGPWQHLRNAVKGLDADPPDAALHEVRIRAKRCRYAAEAVAAIAGKPAREFAKAIAELQEVLGEHQDAVVAEQWLRDYVGRSDGREVFVAGELTAFERDAAHRAREAWPKVWREASRKRLRSWL